MALTDREKAILDFETQWWHHRGAKENAINDTFGITAVRYYQQLNRILDHPDAVAYSPQTVNRLRRITRR